MTNNQAELIIEARNRCQAIEANANTMVEIGEWNEDRAEMEILNAEQEYSERLAQITGAH